MAIQVKETVEIRLPDDYPSSQVYLRYPPRSPADPSSEVFVLTSLTPNGVGNLAKVCENCLRSWDEYMGDLGRPVLVLIYGRDKFGVVVRADRPTGWATGPVDLRTLDWKPV